MRRTRSIWLAVLILLIASTPAHAVDPGPTRIVMFGDSTTQGATGDWTWRYRLWQHLSANQVQADFVGPYSTVADPLAQRFDSQIYADPDFDRDHASYWGGILSEQSPFVTETVSRYQPHVMLVLLGINDLVRLQHSPEQALASLRDFITAAQSAKPDVTVVVGELPWTWIEGVTAFNRGLPDIASQTSTPQSLVTLTSFGGFTECAQTYDRVHLSASGEMAVAAGFARALAGLGIGVSMPDPLPWVPDVPRQVAQNLRAEPGNASVTLRWLNPPGAGHERVWVRDVSVDGTWQVLPLAVAQGEVVLGALANGHEYQFRLQAGRGCRDSDLFSSEVSATPRPFRLARPTVKPRRRGLTISWEPVLPAEGYRVRVGARRAVFTMRPPVTVRGLRAGHKYRVTVTVLRQQPESRSAFGTPKAGRSHSGVPRRARLGVSDNKSESIVRSH